MQKPSDCDQVDNYGICSKCNNNYTLTFGQCVKVDKCANNQYKNNYGTCIDVAPGCSLYNPSSGVCLVCSDGKDAVHGLCCPAGTHALGNRCISDVTFLNSRTNSEQSSSPTCLGYHPTKGECLECNGNFKPNPINMKECI